MVLVRTSVFSEHEDLSPEKEAVGIHLRLRPQVKTKLGYDAKIIFKS